MKLNIDSFYNSDLYNYFTENNKHIHNEFYYIVINDIMRIVDENNIVQKLHIDFEKYKQIMSKHNAFDIQKILNESSANSFAFTSKNDCEEAIEELEPYAIMATLKGGD